MTGSKIEIDECTLLGFSRTHVRAHISNFSIKNFLQLLLYANTPLGVIQCKKDLDEAKKFVLIYFKTVKAKQSIQGKKYGQKNYLAA